MTRIKRTSKSVTPTRRITFAVNQEIMTVLKSDAAGTGHTVASFAKGIVLENYGYGEGRTANAR